MKKILAVILIAVLLYSCYFFFVIPFETKEIPMYVSVEQIIGFNITNESLAFGAMPPGALAQKNITINNGGDTMEFVHITGTGEVNKWVSVSDNNFFVGSGQEKNITVRAMVPSDAKPGRYEGTLKMQFKKII